MLRRYVPHQHNFVKSSSTVSSLSFLSASSSSLRNCSTNTKTPQSNITDEASENNQSTSPSSSEADNNKTQKQQQTVRSTTWKYVLALVALSSTYYYTQIFKPWNDMIASIKKQRPPPRATRLFVTGHEGNSVDSVIEVSGASRTIVTIVAAWRLVLLSSLMSIVCVKALCYWFYLSLFGAKQSEITKIDKFDNKVEKRSVLSTQLAPNQDLKLVWTYVGEQVRDSFEFMGGAFIKLGQWAATRPDLFTDEICYALEDLYNHAPPHDLDLTLKMLERNGVLDKFEKVDPKPMNSGCIAQVHRAWLKAEAAESDVDPVVTLIQRERPEAAGDGATKNLAGVSTIQGSTNVGGSMDESTTNNSHSKKFSDTENDHTQTSSIHDDRQQSSATTTATTLEKKPPVPVVIKVMHPNVMKTLVSDVLCLSWGAIIIEALFERTRYSGVRQSIEEFGALLLTQLDFVREAENLNQFRYNFRTSSTTVFPRPFLSVTKNEILVESFEFGQPLTTLKNEQTKIGGLHESLATVAVSAFLKMIFADNYIHADLHPGNLLARVRNSNGSVSLAKDYDPNGKSELVILDPGLVTTLSDRERTNFISLFACVATGDGDLGAKVILDWMPNLSDCDDVNMYVTDMKNLFDELCPKSLSLADFDISYIMHRILSTMREHKVRFDMNFATLLSSVALSESVGKVLQAKQNIFEVSAPYLIECLKSHELMFLIEKLYKRYLNDKWRVSLADEEMK